MKSLSSLDQVEGMDRDMKIILKAGGKRKSIHREIQPK